MRRECGWGREAPSQPSGLRPDSPVQNPERLHRERGFFLYTLVCFAVCVLLMFTRIPALYDAFEFGPPKTPPLWVFG